MGTNERKRKYQREYDKLKRLKKNGYVTLESRAADFKKAISELPETDFAYMGGIVDGEGCVGLRRVGYKGDKLYIVHLQAHLTVTNSDKRMMQWITERFGGGVCWGKKGNFNGKKDIGNWNLYGRKLAILGERIIPYMLTPKRERLECITELFRVPFEIQWTNRHTLPACEVARRARIMEGYEKIVY